jgi:hypothetical protein
MLAKILLCFTPAIDLGHISDSLEACFSILVHEIAKFCQNMHKNQAEP